MIDTDRSSYEIVLLRLGLLCAGALLLLLSGRVNSSGLLDEHAELVVINVGLGVAGLVCIGAAGLPHLARWLRWGLLAAVIVEIIISTVLWVYSSSLPAYVRIDSGLYLEMAGEMVPRGQNPYDWNFAGVFNVYRTDSLAVTPSLDGDTVGRFPYPALSFLMVVPFQWLGLPGALSLVVVFHVLLMTLLFVCSPRPVQPLVLIPFALGISFTSLTLLGNIDVVWVTFIVGMILAWRRPVWRATLFGLAAAQKQNVWFLAPFLLVHVFQTARYYIPESDSNAGLRVGLRAAATFFGGSFGIFFVVNMPYLLWNPVKWVEGIFTPMAADMVILSQGGLSGITQFGYLSLPKAYYLLTSFIVLVVTLFVYWRHYDMLRNTYIIAPMLITWFSYRTIVSYWIYWAFPALALFFAPPVTPSTALSRRSWRLTLGVTVSGVALLLVVGIVVAQPQTVAMRLVPPLVTDQGVVFRMTVELFNNTDHVIEPRFFVHHQGTTNNPLPWKIEHGPLTLDPGQTALYGIYSDGALAFPAHNPAQIVMTHAGGDYQLQAVATIDPDETFLWPDAIANPNFWYWDATGSTPIFWEPRIQPYGAGKISLARKDGRTAVQLWVTNDYGGAGRVRLITDVPVPREPFGMWIFLDGTSPTVERGLEIRDERDRRLTFLFGTRDYAEFRVEDHYVIERVIPVNTWVYEEFDLPSAYAQAGWDLPPFVRVNNRSVEADFRLVSLGFFTDNESSQDNTRLLVSAIQQDYRISPEELMTEIFDDPAAYYVRLGDYYRLSHNDERARQAYLRALYYAPDNNIIRQQLETLEQLCDS